MLNATAPTLADIARQTSGTSTLSRPVRLGDRGIGSELISPGKRMILDVRRDRDGTTGALDGTIAIFGANLPHPTAGSPLGNAFAAAASPAVQQLRPDGATLLFQTLIPFAAFVNYNWIVETGRFRLTGTVTIAAGVITGAATDFDPELDVGDVVEQNGKRATVTARTSDTAAVLDDASFTAVAGSIIFNVSRSKRIKRFLASPAGPDTFAVTNVGGFARIDFAVAPPAQPDINGYDMGEEAINVYLVAPVELMAIGAHVFERTSVLGRTVVWVVGTHAANLLSRTLVVAERAVAA